MADADVPITAGSGTKVDTRTVGAGTDEHRQVVVLGDPTTAANVAIVDASGRILSVVSGDVAHDDPDSGKPVKIGGKGSSSAPSQVTAEGDRVDGWFGKNGQQAVMIRDANGIIAGSAGFSGDDGTTAAVNSLITQGHLFAYNGATWDRVRTAPSADAQVRTGIPAAGVVGFNGTTWDRQRTVDGFKTASATPDVGLAAAIAPDRRYPAVTVATTGSTTLIADTNGATHALVRVNTATTGTYHFEVTDDGTNWSQAEVFHGPTDQWVSGVPQTPASGNYRVLTLGYRALRVTVVTTLGATVSMVPNLTALPGIITAINTGPSAHADGQTHVWKRTGATTAQTGTAIWTPASGKKIVLLTMNIGVGGVTAGTCTVWFGATADTTYTAGTDQPVFEHEFAPSATLKPGVIMGTGAGVIGEGAIDEVLRLTTTNALTITVIVRGYETV